MVRHYPGGPRSSEVTKQLILDVAERLCAEGGVEALSVRAVCEQAGANVASISYHFGNKQRLLESNRVLRRLHFLREWSHEQEQQIFA